MQSSHDNKTPDSWNKLESILLLSDSEHRRDLAFILGAGVSGPKMPDWPTLVRDLATKSKCGLEKVQLAQAEGWQWPRIASYIRDSYLARGPRIEGLRGLHRHAKAVSKWSKLMRKCMYAGLTTWMNDKGLQFPERLWHTCDKAEKHKIASALKDFAARVREERPVLAQIVKMCGANRKKQVADGPGIAAVITFNFDSLVQEYDRAIHRSPKALRTIERASKSRHVGKIPLYQVHGLLRPTKPIRSGKEDTDDGDYSKETPDRLVFCEDEYTERSDNLLGFATTTILQSLREHTCIFVGCSMTDELMRRALLRNRKELVDALKAEEVIPEKWERKLRRHFAVVQVRPSYPTVVVDDVKNPHALACALRREMERYAWLKDDTKKSLKAWKKSSRVSAELEQRIIADMNSHIWQTQDETGARRIRSELGKKLSDGLVPEGETKSDGAKMNRMIEEDLEALGVWPLWVKNFDELPARLEELERWLKGSPERAG